jgi:dolichol kinase
LKDLKQEIQKDKFRVELVRKGIHLFSLSIPIIYYYISRNTALIILIPSTLILIALDFMRFYSKSLADLWSKSFGFVLRQHEVGSKKTLTGGTYVLISASLCVFLFPKVLVITSFAILIISDISAALIGKKFGKIKIYGKTLEGSTAFFVSAIIVILFTPKIIYHPMEYVIAIVSAFFGALAELFSFNILDDNLAIPLSISIIMWGLYIWFLPGINIYALDIIK